MRDPYEHYGCYRRTDSKHKSRMPVIALGMAVLTGAAVTRLSETSSCES